MRQSFAILALLLLACGGGRTPTASPVAATPAEERAVAAATQLHSSWCHGGIAFDHWHDRETAWVNVCGTLRSYTCLPDGCQEGLLASVAAPQPMPASPSYQGSGGGGGSVQVRGYHRRDGTYVRPHSRSRPRR